jgi:ABC-type sugar transport system, permease component
MDTEAKLSKKSNIVYCIISVVLLCVLLFPLYWIFVTSIKTEKEIFQIPPTFWPKVLNVKSYLVQLNSGDFNMFRSFRNSLVISIGAMLISIVLAVPASYGIAKYHFKGKKAIILGFLVTQMLPVSVLLTPLFITFQKMHLYNTFWSTILSDATIGIPFSVLILKNFFATIPKELEEASYIDGCNKFTGFIKVLIPIAKPGVIVCGIFSFLYGWGDLAYGMTFILDQKNRPITAGIFNFMGQYGTKWSYLTAFAVVTIIPVALIFILMQKYIISGMTSGAVKG